MLSPQRAAQLGLGSGVLVLVLCMGVLIVSAQGVAPDAGTTPMSVSASTGTPGDALATVSPARVQN